MRTPPPPPVWPFKTWMGKPYTPPRQRKPAPAYPTKAQKAPF